jgi:ligand-binding SRPBCC domain-containing protein
MPTIILETQIKAKAEICYNLSLSVDLHKASTQKTGEYIVAGVKSGMMKLGETVTWKAKHFGLWQELSTQISDATPFIYFKDVMIKGAFKSMEHEHFFEEKQTETLMKDVFKFSSPLGILGKLFNTLILKRYMTDFLMERNEMIKKIAETEDWKKYM